MLVRMHVYVIWYVINNIKYDLSQEYSNNYYYFPLSPCGIGSNPGPPALQADSLPSEPPGKPKNTGVGSLSLLQGIFLIQELNGGLLHCRWILYQLRYQVRPTSLVLIYNWKFLPFDRFQPIPCPPTSYPLLLVATNLISFPMNFCVSFWITVNLQHDINFGVQHRNWIFLHITKWSLW